VAADRELPEFQSISHLRHVVRPIQQLTILLKVRRTTARPINCNDTHSEFTGDAIVRTKIESRTDPTVEEEDRTPFAISVLLIRDLPTVGKPYVARVDHHASSFVESFSATPDYTDQT
jgi:hypothetical protein